MGLKIYRQGDVLIVGGFIPTNAKVTPTQGRIVLAEGEMTGHAHAVADTDCVLYEVEGSMYIRVNNQTQVLHEEHAPIDLIPGDYQIIRQREYRPLENIRVAD